jgi:putative sterol carrier protein
MAEQPPVPESVTPEQFFEQLLPMGFAAQAAEQATPPQDITLGYHLTGAGAGDWRAVIKDGQMTVSKGGGEADLAFTVSVDDWRDAVLARNGADLSIIIPQGRQGRPENAQRARLLKGTLALELSRDGTDPFKCEMTFNNAATPRTTIKMKIADYVAMQTGRLNGQEAFMTGKMRVEGDMAFLMQIAALTA